MFQSSDLEGAAPPRLIIWLSRNVGERTALPEAVSSFTRNDDDLGIGARRLFSSDVVEKVASAQSSDIRTAAVQSSGDLANHLSRFYVYNDDVENLHNIRQALENVPDVEAVYVKPHTLLPSIPGTPDLTANQGYLGAPPAGLNATYAWTVAGGGGAGVRVIDVEGDWNLEHEDFPSISRITSGAFRDLAWRNHGTAVLGEMGGVHNGFGVDGIAPDAQYDVVSHRDLTGGSAEAISLAASNLQGSTGVMLLEMHRPGPRFGFVDRPDQRGFIAVEWWEDDLAAIQAATSFGIVVVEAAGNGAEDLDDALYDTPATGFSAAWTNPFRRTTADSGAIVVGAGASATSTSGDRSKLGFSNYGGLIDAQGWGEDVTSTGYGDAFTGAGENQFYTNRFSGTSSASPMIAASVACVQGFLLAKGVTPLTPLEMRNLFRTTGSPQTGAAPLPRIGNRPDLQQLIAGAAALRGVTP